MTIHRKTRSDSRMERLTPAQKDAAFAHCQTIGLIDAVRWLNDQFKIRISKSSLSEWLKEQRIERSMAAELTELRDNQQGVSVINKIAAASTPITVANSVLFSNAVFSEFKKPLAERDETRLVRYMHLALKARDLEIRATAVQLSAQRLRSVSKPATPAAVERPRACDEISQEKIDEIMLRLFGEEPDGFVNEDGSPADWH